MSFPNALFVDATKGTDILIGHRLFFALLPRLTVAKQIDALRRTLGSGTPVERERLHSTLWVSDVFQNFPQELGELMLKVGSATKAERITETLTQVSCKEKHAVLRPEHSCKAGRKLANQLRGEMSLLGYESPRKQFNFHVTLLYALSGRSFARFSRPIEPIQWCAEDFVLIHSLIGQHQHHVLSRWSLELPSQREFSFE